MNTVILNCSPKKSASASSYFSKIISAFIKGSVTGAHLRSKGDHARILEAVQNADTVVFCMPMYVDAAPAHVLEFLKNMERFCREKDLHIHVYLLSNGGFIEGNQNRVLMQIMKNFCRRSGNIWKGGIGIGGGVMLNVTRILLPIFALLLLLSILVSGICYGNWIAADAWKTFSVQLLVLLYLNAGVLLFTAKMARSINTGTDFGEHYTRIMLPSFLFIFIADIYFLIASVFQGGLFRNWLAKK